MTLKSVSTLILNNLSNINIKVSERNIKRRTEMNEIYL